MPYLNWKEAPIRQEASAHPARGTQLTLVMSCADLLALLPRIEEVFAEPGTELRVDLPRGWILFWKLRDPQGGSRLLMAHPQAEEWVGTLALEPDHASALVSALRALAAGEHLEVGRAVPVDRISNFELAVHVT